MFQFGVVPTTNVLRKIAKEIISAIDHITNSIVNNKFKTVDISVHFSIIYAFKLKMNLISIKLSFYMNVLLKSVLMQIWKFFVSV